MSTARRSSRLSRVEPPAELASGLVSERELRKRAARANVQQQQGQQEQPQHSQPGRNAGAQPGPYGQPEQPLETLSSILEAYFGPQSDVELMEAAEGVAEIWLQHDNDVRARTKEALRPLLQQEEARNQRAAAVAALKQARRDRFAEQGPRLTRMHAGEGEQQQQPAGSSRAATGACANNADDSSQHSSKRRRTLRSGGPPPPPSPLLNNRQQRQQQRERMKEVTPMPADLNGSSMDEATRIGGSGTRSGSDGSTVNSSHGSRSTPGVDSLGQQQPDESSFMRSVSRRKQQWRPCHAALQ